MAGACTGAGGMAGAACTGAGGMPGAATGGAGYLGAGGGATLGVPLHDAALSDSANWFVATPPEALRHWDSKSEEDIDTKLPLDMGDGVDSVSKVRPMGDTPPPLAASDENSWAFGDAPDSFSISGLIGGSEGLPDVVLSEASEWWSSTFESNTAAAQEPPAAWAAIAVRPFEPIAATLPSIPAKRPHDAFSAASTAGDITLPLWVGVRCRQRKWRPPDSEGRPWAT
mmetsp:Transcript_39615/g.84457  ORF Transcript_39615/g.84457 Transcript_39615/m.84457 type:complete len:227 (+) Transcript_39615:396-1076(+)